MRLEDPFLERQDALLAAHFGDSPADQKRAREHVACWLTSDRVTKDRTLQQPRADKALEAERQRELAALAQLRTEWRALDAERQRAIGGATPPVPPKYASSDFQRHSYWRLRGKLDVPKECFIAYPLASPESNPTPLVGWAGWDHAQRASALVQVLRARQSEGWAGEQLAPLLQGLAHLVPWLHQWHEKERATQVAQFLESETLAAGLTPDQLHAWQPPARRARRKKTARRG